jgi:hypothetical protein
MTGAVNRAAAFDLSILHRQYRRYHSRLQPSGRVAQDYVSPEPEISLDTLTVLVVQWVQLHLWIFRHRGYPGEQPLALRLTALWLMMAEHRPMKHQPANNDTATI